MKKLIEDICFELSVEDTHSCFDYENSTMIQAFIDICESEYSDRLTECKEAQLLIEKLKSELLEFKKKTHSLTKNDLKSVYMMLKNRELNPRGCFDSRGRFYLDDDELVDVRPPSAKYPYTQMKAGRTSKFVEAIADKYACKTHDELVARFKKA